MFTSTFCPRGWLETDGRMLPIEQYQSLFSLLRDNFGGDGRTYFALPDLRGRVAIGVGAGPGLSPYTLGQTGGSERVALDIHEMPDHTHAVSVSDKTGDGTTSVAAGAKDDLGKQAGAILPSGMSQPHENRPPFQVIRYCICVKGIYPERP